MIFLTYIHIKFPSPPDALGKLWLSRLLMNGDNYGLISILNMIRSIISTVHNCFVPGNYKIHVGKTNFFIINVALFTLLCFAFIGSNCTIEKKINGWGSKFVCLNKLAKDGTTCRFIKMWYKYKYLQCCINLSKLLCNCFPISVHYFSFR